MRRLLVVALVALLAPAARLSAQLITCPQAPAARPDDACVLIFSGPQMDVEVKVTGPGGVMPHVPVTFTAQRGAIFRRATTDAAGIAKALWRADPALTGPDTVLAALSDGLVHAQRRIVLVRAPTPSAITLRKVVKRVVGKDTLFQGEGATWYIERQIRGPFVVELTGVTPTECRAAGVIFRAIGDGATSPDTVRADIVVGGECRAEAWWRLGKTIGVQHLRASLVGQPTQQVTFRGYARNTPWLAAGLVAYWEQGHRHVSTTSRTIEVVSDGPTADTTRTITETTSSPEKLEGRWAFRPTLGINFPIVTRWHRVRVSLSADAQNVDERWFAGVSLLQLLKVTTYEDVGMDLHLVLQASSLRHVTNYDRCNPGLAAPVACETARRFRLDGIGAMAQLNASSFLTPILALFPK